MLDLCLRYSPNDELLAVLESEQLPKLKTIFDLPIAQATMRRKHVPHVNHQSSSSSSPQSQLHKQNSNASIDSSLLVSTPRSNKQNSGFLNESQSTKSFMKQFIQSENITGRNIISYLVGNSISNNNNNNNNTTSVSSNEKTSSSQLTASSSAAHSHRESISSIKSINSDDDSIRNKIVLDETVNPKRPPRPKCANGNGLNNNALSSPSNSNQSSRPISHLSGDDLSSISLQQLNLANKLLDLMQEEDNDGLDTASISSLMMRPPPPKPPKSVNAKIKQLNQCVNQQQQISHENVNGENGAIYETQNTTTKSTVSLNSIQFKTLTSKTTSDSVLNRDLSNV